MPREKSIGELYSEIPSSLDDFEKAETKLVKREMPRFVYFCKSIYLKFPSLGKGGKFNDKNKEAVEFLNWDLNAEEFVASFNFVLICSFLLAALLAGIIYLSPIRDIVAGIAGSMDFLVPFYLLAPPLFAAVAITNWFQNYPSNAAKKEQVKSLTYVPEIVGYMNMSMKLVPNLEKAIEFSAEHGRGKIAEDFKKLIWEVQIGIYSTLSEGLDVLAYRWGKFSEEFKKALMMIRASVIEDSEAKRYAVLDKTMDEVLLSIREKMEKFARDLSQPTVVLFYVGILLPLILIIILPIGSAFSGLPFANPVVLFILYDLVIPAITLFFAIRIIDQRPPIYEPPVIADDYPGLPKKWTMQFGKTNLDIRLGVVAILFAGTFLSFFLSSQGFPPKMLIGDNSTQLIPFDKNESFVLARAGFKPDYFEIEGTRYKELLASTGNPIEAEKKLLSEKKAFFMSLENDVAPYNLIFGLILTISAAIAFYLYFSSIYKRKVQLEIMQLESEFKDSVYLVASRLGENKPVEDALKYTKDFLPNAKISQRVFGKTLDNISFMAMPLDAAVFDPNYGSMKNLPSNVIRSSMKLLVDSVKLGVNVAARTMISLSMQLSNMEKVSNMLKNLVSEMVATMRTMSLIVGPIVLGITTSLQRVVVITIASLSYSSITSGAQQLSQDTLAAVSGVPTTFTNMNLGTLIKADALAEMADPTQFIIIIALYVIELVIILNYFTTKLEEDNDLLVKQNLAVYLPLSVLIFVVSVLASNFIVSMFLGGGIM